MLPPLEVSHRIAQMRQELRPLQVGIGKRKALGTHTEAKCTDALALSKMSLNCSVWEPVSSRVLAKLSAAQS
eukprot:9255310-Pyramimonas_sp.AAC.1